MAIIDRIKFSGIQGREWLIYRYPGEDFVMGSQLIVGEGQVAVFVKGGEALDTFTPGTYTLSTSNIPLLGGVINAPFGRKTPFTAEIYFINITSKLDIRWGTVDPIQVIDPKYHIKLRVRGFGQFGVKIQDYRRFLTEVIGSMGDYEVVSYTKLIEYFKGVLVTKVKALIAEAIIDQGISALEIAAKIDDISEFSKTEISAEFERFGLKVVNFFIQSINFPDEDFEEINKILKDKAAFEIIGDSRYVSKRSFDVMESAAKNQNGTAGVFAGAGIGLGAGIAAGNAMGDISTRMNTGVPNAQPSCPSCGAVILGDSAFCGSCGKSLKPVMAKCPSCSKEVLPENKFCSHCGSPMNPKVKCEKCGFENDKSNSFCSECGESLK